MTVLITLSGVGSSAGPTFDLYSSPDGITFTLFAPGINKTVLEAGYTTTVPNGTTDIKVTSVGQCTNSYIATIGVIPTTTTTTTTAAPIRDFCVNWTAANEGNIRMSTQGYIDFTEVLNGRTLQPGPLSVGQITGYVIAGMPEFSLNTPINMTIVPSTNRATWSTSALDAVTDKVLTTLIYNLELIFSDNSDYFIPNVNYSGQTSANVIPGQLTSSYNNCTP